MPRPKRSHDDCPYEGAAQTLKRIGGRWKVLIVRRLLVEGTHGFNELQRALPRVTAKMLAQQLRELEADGLVTREELVSTPPKTTRYSLTGLGLALRPTIDAMSAWGARAQREAVGTRRGAQPDEVGLARPDGSSS